MKKFMISLCLILAVAFTAEAQIRRPAPRYRQPIRKSMPMRQARDYRTYNYNPIGDVRFHVIGDLGVSDFGAIIRHEIPYHFSVGGMVDYQVGHMTSIGLGAEYYSTYGEHCYLFENMQETYIHTIPIYANLRLALPNTPVSPFIEGRLGYSLPAGKVTCLDQSGNHQYVSTGLYTAGAIGIKIYRTYLSWGVSVIDVVDSALGFSNGRADVITDYYIRLSFAL